MDPIAIIVKFYDPRGKAYAVLLNHGNQVAAKALEVARQVPHLNPDPNFIREAAMLHDIGIFLTRTPELGCIGRHSYVCHGYLGGEVLEEMGLSAHALVCERHVGAGLTAAEIRSQNLPLPERDMIPLSIEEKIITYADNFFSKFNGRAEEKPVGAIIDELARYGIAVADRFRSWVDLFERDQ